MSSTMTRVDPGQSKYAGVYYRESVDGVKTFYINYRRYGKPTWEKVGKETDRFNKTQALDIRIERIRAEKLDAAAPHLQKVPTVNGAFKKFVEKYVPIGPPPDLRQVRHVGNQVAMGDHSALRLTGRAGSVHDGGKIFALVAIVRLLLLGFLNLLPRYRLGYVNGRRLQLWVKNDDQYALLA